MPKTTHGFDATPLSSVIATEIVGLDLNQPLRAETVAVLRNIWLERGVLVFRDNDLTVEDQIRFAG